jgi:hypothetical protein
MKKSLSDMKPKEVATSEEEGQPTEKSFGAFKQVDGNQATIDLAQLRQHNVFFATPCYGGMLTDQFFLSMFRVSQAFMQHGINFRITTLRNESLITRARNILTAMFLESDCTHLMFIDSDIEFDVESVLRALAYDKPIMAAAYPKKALPIQYAINFKFVNQENRQIRVENGAVEVLDASTGFFLVKRETVEKMCQAYPELHYRNDSNIDERFNKYCYALFDTWLDPDDNRYLSEDYTFCRRWQKIGGEIWLDPNTKLNHVGSYTFEGDVGKIINRQE